MGKEFPRSADTRLFEQQDEKSSKFWEVAQDAGTVTVRYGKDYCQPHQSCV